MASSKTVVFVHGLFQNPKSWERWEAYFRIRGFSCHSPAYPFHSGEPADLRRNFYPALGKLTLSETVRSLSDFIRTLPERAVLIGHSMGGLAVQQLISRQLGVAGICIDSAPPKGIISLEWSFLRANFPTINPLKGNSVCLPSLEWFHYAFCHTMSLDETAREYELFVVPESRNIPRSSTLSDGAVDFSKPHPPLLFIAGARDHIIPPSLNRKNAGAYSDKNSITDFMLFPDRTHYICGQQGWEEVAEYCHGWIQKITQ